MAEQTVSIKMCIGTLLELNRGQINRFTLFPDMFENAAALKELLVLMKWVVNNTPLYSTNWFYKYHNDNC